MPNGRFFILFAFASLGLATLIPSTYAANKIAVITLHQPVGDADNPLQENTGYAAREGVLAAFGQTYQQGVTHYPLDNGYSIELHTHSHDDNPLIALSNDPDVIAIICNTSNDCVQAVDDQAAKDVLVTTISAMSSIFSRQENIIRMAPSNGLLAEAFYRRMKSDGIEGFAVVYELSLYAMDLYAQLMSSYFIDLLTEAEKPMFVSVFPITDHAGLSDSQQGTTSAQIVPILSELKVDGVLYIGYSNSFNALFNHPDSSSLRTKKWYADDALFPRANGFANLQIFHLYKPEYKDIHAYYYYGFDAGTFVKKVIDSYGNTPPQRADLIAKAKLTALDSNEAKTGIKTFDRADEFGYFNVQHFDEEGQPSRIEETSVSVR